MTAHFFDIDTLIVTDSKVWVVSKAKPGMPLLKIDQSEFKLIQSGIFTNKGEKIKIGNQSHWVSIETLNQIKRSCKKNSVDISDLYFSMQEFNNPEVIKNLDTKIYKEHLYHLRNSGDKIYLLCQKNTFNNYKHLIDKIEEYLESIGLKLHKYYALSETFLNRDEDQIVKNKSKIFLQHLSGYKTDRDEFSDNRIEEYDTIIYYDTDENSIEFTKRINNLLKFIYDNSTDSTKEDIKNALSKTDKKIVTNLVTFNLMNPFIKSETVVNLYNLVKSFESFRYRY
jgi:hypothetical protein